MPLVLDMTMYSPPGVFAMNRGPATLADPIAELIARGTAVSPMICQMVLLLVPFAAVGAVIRNNGPRSPDAITLGVEIAWFNDNGTGGNLTRPMACIWSGSTMVMFSPPVFTTYSVFPSGVSASERGSWPTLMPA